MCTRFVYNRNKILGSQRDTEDPIVGFNFDIDLSVWTHKVIGEKDRFFIGIKMPDNRYHSFHGINRNGNVGTLLYVNGNKNGEYCEGEGYITIADLTERFIKGEILLDDALDMVQDKKIVYAKDATMQAMLSDKKGRVLVIEPGVGYRFEHTAYSLITNYSVLNPEITRPYIVPGDDRFERADKMLKEQRGSFSVAGAFDILRSVRQEGLWATRVSFVYSVRENRVFYVLNNDFGNVMEYGFDGK